MIVDYAHTPDSLDIVLQAARELGSGRLICVFGAGGDRDRGKRPVMGAVAVQRADHVIVTSDNPRSEDPLAIIQDILQGAGVGVEIDPDRRSAIHRAVALAGRGRRRRDRRQGARAGPGDGRRGGAVRRSRRRARGAARGGVRRVTGRSRGVAMIPVEWDELEALDSRRARVAPRTAAARRSPAIKADSRVVGPGDLFVALNTGVDHVAGAAARGAATLVPRDQEAALAALASLVRSKSDARVVAVVGSTGKTSTKDILGALCGAVTPTIWAGGEPEQRDRPAADGVQARAGDRDPRHRDGHARARADRRALRDRAARRRRRLVDRPGAPRARRHRRAGRRGERRGDRRAAAGWASPSSPPTRPSSSRISTAPTSTSAASTGPPSAGRATSGCSRSPAARSR